MIDFLSWVAMALVVAQLWVMGSKRYRIGWWCGLAASVAWAIWCIMTGAWALLAQQVVVAGLAVRALRNLKESS